MPVTPIFGWRYPELGNEANVPLDLEHAVKDVETTLKELEPKRLKTAGAGDAAKLLIVDGTGAAAFKAMSGDAIIGTLGVITIANEAVNAAKILNQAITNAKLGGEAVGTEKIANLAVTAAKLAAEAVETAKIANLAVTEAKLAALAVGTAKIAELAVTEAKLATALKERLGITANTAFAKITAGEEEKNTAGAFALMPTPDEAPGIVLPAKGLIIVSFQALWDGGVTGNATQAAIFLGANQLKVAGAAGAPVVQKAETIATTKRLLTSSPLGLVTNEAASELGVTTGLAMAASSPASSTGLCLIQAAAGTYNVSVKFNSTSVRAKERRLYVWTAQFN